MNFSDRGFLKILFFCCNYFPNSNSQKLCSHIFLCQVLEISPNLPRKNKSSHKNKLGYIKLSKFPFEFSIDKELYEFSFIGFSESQFRILE